MLGWRAPRGPPRAAAGRIATSLIVAPGYRHRVRPPEGASLRRGRRAVLVLTTCLALLSVPFVPDLALLGPVLAVAGLWWVPRVGVTESETGRWVGAGLAIGSTGALLLLARQVLEGPVVVTAAAVCTLAGGVGLWLVRGRPSGRAAAGALAGAVLLAGGLGLATLPEVGIDVHHLHEAATRALAEGRSPWQGLAVADTSPWAPEGALIDGYPYPVVTLAVTALGVLAGDPRIALWVAWLLGLLVLLRRRRSRGDLLALAGLVMLPTTVAVIAASWTEPVTWLGLVGSLALWRHRTASSLLLGLALASKQYLVVLAPLILLMRTSRRRRALTAATALAAGASGFLLGEGHLEAVMGFHSGRPVRTDATNLVGLLDLGGLDPVIVNTVALLLAGGLAAWGARRVAGPRSFARVAVLALGAFFLLSSQAFANYWWLVVGLVVVGEVVDPATESGAAGGEDPGGAAAGPPIGSPPAGPAPRPGGSLAGT